MRTIHLKGNHYEMGRQHGLQSRESRPLILAAIEARFAEQGEDDERFAPLLRETLNTLEALDPPLLEVIRGQAEGLNLDLDTLLRYDVAFYYYTGGVLLYPGDVLLTEMAEACSTWAATGEATRDGESILVKNRDQQPEHLALQVAVMAEPDVGYRYAYVTSAGSPGVFCAGMNEVGLAVADTAVASRDVGPGIPDYSLMMHVLEEHNSVPSALDYLKATTRMGRNNLILADAGGDLAVFEIGHKNYGVIHPDGPILVNTNHFVSPEMKDSFVDVNPPALKGNSLHRYERLTKELMAAWGEIDVPFARRLMAQHGSPLDSLCRHPVNGQRGRTISTTIFLPVERAFLACLGNPCEGEFRLFAPW